MPATYKKVLFQCGLALFSLHKDDILASHDPVQVITLESEDSFTKERKQRHRRWFVDSGARIAATRRQFRSSTFDVLLSFSHEHTVYCVFVAVGDCVWRIR